MFDRNSYHSRLPRRITILALALSCGSLAQTPSVLAIRNARIYPASAPVIENGSIVVRNGLIESIGPSVSIPPDAWVIEGAGLTVYPGLIDALSTWGLPAAPAPAPAPESSGPPPARGPEDRPSNTSWLHAQDLLQPAARNILSARNAGYTTAVVFPTAGIFAGQGAAMNLAGEKSGAMMVAARAGLYLSLTTRGFNAFPGSLMGVIAYIRQVYADADFYRIAGQAYQQNPRGRRRPDYDRALEGVLEAPRILLPATRAVEIERMIRLAAELKRPVVLYGGHEAARSVDTLARSNTPVLVNLKWPEQDPNDDPEDKPSLRTLELRENAPAAPAALAKAGVRFAFYSGGVERPAGLRKAVRRAISAGLSTEDAVRALTLNAAEIHGFADRAGSLEPGKIANLTITEGDLFLDSTKVKHIVIDGNKYEPVPEPPTPPEAKTQ
jgi:imidazolonepropionase-like amidohydrolase